MSSNNVGHLITKTITILQHFVALHHTLSNYTSLHLSTLHFLSDLNGKIKYVVEITDRYPCLLHFPLNFKKQNAYRHLYTKHL